MNANQKFITEREYRADLSDAYHLASNMSEWLGVLITQAKENLDNPYRAKTLLEIAEYLAVDTANDFDNLAKKHK